MNKAEQLSVTTSNFFETLEMFRLLTKLSNPGRYLFDQCQQWNVIRSKLCLLVVAVQPRGMSRISFENVSKLLPYKISLFV